MHHQKQSKNLHRVSVLFCYTLLKKKKKDYFQDTHIATPSEILAFNFHMRSSLQTYYN